MRKPRIILTGIVCVCLQLQAHAQTGFNRRYDTYSMGYTQGCDAVELRPNGGYHVIHMTVCEDSVQAYFITALLVLDEFGGLDTVTRVPLNLGTQYVYSGWANSSHQTQDGGLIIGGNLFGGSEGPRRAALLKFGPDGHFHWVTSYQPTAVSWVGYQAKQASDGGYLLAGRCTQDSHDGFLIKTDAQGEMEWWRIYTAPGNNPFLSVDELGEGYVLGGQLTTSTQGRDLWVVRTDAQGEPLWEKIWGSPVHDPQVHVASLADGHVLAAGAINSGTAFGRLYMAKLNGADGSFIWQHYYSPPYNDAIVRAAHELWPGGDIIAVGQASPVVIQNRGFLMRTTSAGDSLWLRYYAYHDSIVTDGRGFLQDVQRTPDGGFIAVGTAYSVASTTHPGMGYGQDVWVIKVDSMGCLEPGCHLITGIETQITNLRGALVVAPNPVAQGGSVQVLLDLPEGFAVQGALRITVTDAMGRVVQEQTLSGVAGHRELRGTKQEGVPASLSTTQLPSGLYHIHLSDASRWIAGAKLVVE